MLYNPLEALLTVFPETDHIPRKTCSGSWTDLKHEHMLHRHQQTFYFEVSVGLLGPVLILSFRCSGSDGFCRGYFLSFEPSR